MDIAEVAERLRIERTLVSHVRAALWVALRAEIQPSNGHHWLERFIFLVESFSRHLRRLFAIEEDGGYMAFLIDSQQPGLGSKADALRQEHAHLLAELESICQSARGSSSGNVANLFAVQQRLHGFLQTLERHCQGEHELCVDAFMVDIGGEG